MRTKIIATGLTGLIGSRIAELLSDKYNFLNFSLENRVDITNFSLLEKKFSTCVDAKIVIHLAGFTDVNAAYLQNGDKNGSCYQVNVIGSKNIAQLCTKSKKYLIHISTDFVFDGKNPPSGGYRETDKPQPLKNEWYSLTKYLAEQEVIKSGCDSVILRLAFPFKAKPAPKKLEPKVKLDLVRTIMLKLKNHEKMKMFTDQYMTPLFIDDFVKVIEKCLRVKPKGIFHTTGSTSLSAYELGMKIAKVFNLDNSKVEKITLKEFSKLNPLFRPRPKNTSLSNKKLFKELGIKMSTIDEALKMMKLQLE